MTPPRRLALVSLGTTPGLRHADAALASLLVEAGQPCDLVRVGFGATGRLRRHIAVTDLVEALAGRRAARALTADAVIFSGHATAFLRHDRARPFALRFDTPMVVNRPGAAGAWQRAAERRTIAGARLLLPYGRAGADAVAPQLPRDRDRDGGGPAVTPLAVPVDERPASGERDIAAVTYAGWPWKRGLELVCDAWTRAGARGRLVVGGLTRDRGLAWLARHGMPEPPGVEWAGSLPRAQWLELVGRACVFVNASRREDYGHSQLEALALGTPLVTVPSPGAYEALPLARALAPGLVAASVDAAALAPALAAGLALSAADRAAYAAAAADLLAPYRRPAVLGVLQRDVLPVLLATAR